MKLPVIVGSGQAMTTFVIIGLPAAVLGSLFLAIAVILSLKDDQKKGKAMTVMALVGAALLGLAFVSPALVQLFQFLSGRVR